MQALAHNGDPHTQLAVPTLFQTLDERLQGGKGVFGAHGRPVARGSDGGTPPVGAAGLAGYRGTSALRTRVEAGEGDPLLRRVESGKVTDFSQALGSRQVAHALKGGDEIPRLLEIRLRVNFRFDGFNLHIQKDDRVADTLQDTGGTLTRWQALALLLAQLIVPTSSSRPDGFRYRSMWTPIFGVEGLIYCARSRV